MPEDRREGKNLQEEEDEDDRVERGPLSSSSSAADLVQTTQRKKTQKNSTSTPKKKKNSKPQNLDPHQFGLVHISAGDLLRAEVAAGTPNGAEAKKHMDAGQLVPNSVVVEMVKSRLNQEDALTNGWLLDGYPRSAEQAEAIAAAGIEPDLFLLVDVPDDDLVERVTGRRLDPVTGEIYHLRFRPPPAGDAEVAARLTRRSDDTEEALRARLATHHSNVAAVVGYYEGVMVKVDGAGKVDDVFGTIDAAVRSCAEGGGAEAAAA